MPAPTLPLPRHLPVHLQAVIAICTLAPVQCIAGAYTYAPSFTRAAERGATRDDLRAAQYGLFVPGINRPQ